jgi:succinoglycan biosynthesis protein ExoA
MGALRCAHGVDIRVAARRLARERRVKRFSVIVPCRNERAFVDAFLDALAAQRLPVDWSVEWLVADGGSDDGTREWLDARARVDARLFVVDNPRRIVSTGLNACLARARGEVIARLDVHTTYADDYLAQCLTALERSGADNVGGPWVAAGDTPMQRAIAAAFQSRWVVGGARSRDTAYEGPAETVYLGCWPRATFERFGGFDEALVRNQDDEHNLRMVRGGGRVWQSAAIRSIYRPRAGLAQLFAQQRQYGYWRAFVLRKHGAPASWRQLAPATFVMALGMALLASPWAGGPLVALLGAYGLYLAFVSVTVAGARWSLLWRLPLAIAAYHVGYGLGTWQGFAAIGFGRAPSPALTGLTR